MKGLLGVLCTCTYKGFIMGIVYMLSTEPIQHNRSGLDRSKLDEVLSAKSSHEWAVRQVRSCDGHMTLMCCTLRMKEMLKTHIFNIWRRKKLLKKD